MSKPNVEHYLEKDTVIVPGQQYAIISIISPSSRQQHDKLAVKIRGAFSTMDDAKKHAERLQKQDSTFDIFVVDMYSWLPLPPDKGEIGEQHYADNKLEELIQGHVEELDRSKEEFEKYKREQMETDRKKTKELVDKSTVEESEKTKDADDKSTTEESEKTKDADDKSTTEESEKTEEP
jgi:hypothetical protein